MPATFFSVWIVAWPRWCDRCGLALLLSAPAWALLWPFKCIFPAVKITGAVQPSFHCGESSLPDSPCTVMAEVVEGTTAPMSPLSSDDESDEGESPLGAPSRVSTSSSDDESTTSEGSSAVLMLLTENQCASLGSPLSYSGEENGNVVSDSDLEDFLHDALAGFDANGADVLDVLA